MALIAAFEGNIRITEEADVRITEDGLNNRVLQNPNIGVGTIVVDGVITPFAGNLYVKNSGLFQIPITYCNVGGTFILADNGYIKDNDIWKKVF